MQRGHHFAIVDEVDSILIDEARTPLIISGPAEQSARWYGEFARIAPLMKRDVHYEVEESKRTVAVSEEGVEFVEDQLGIDNLYEAVNSPLISYLNNALKAKELFHRDQEYIVSNGEVLIVDEFTGRVLAGRRYNEGMHQAIEAKERVEIKDENQTLATITLQNYFRLYEKLSGMTGTASTEAAELHQTYKLGVVPIPTNRPMVREDRSDVIYKTEKAKFDAVVDDIAERNEAGQPVLVGTASVEKSELLAKFLLQRGIPHEVLNAKNHAREAHIVAQAGRLGGVTVSTNMAGRGTDIQLGGNPDFIADEALRARGLSPSETPEEYEAAWDAAFEEAKNQVKAEHEEVVQAGGLYVLGTERHESRRIDNQLRGRSGRQGDPGESRFYLSLGDDLMRRFNGPMLESMMTTLRVPDDQPIESKMVTRAIRSAQTQVEAQNFEVRKDVLKYDEVLNRQRTVIYDERRKVLEGADLHVQIQSMLDDVVGAYVDGATETGYAEEWDLEQLWTGLKALYPVALDRRELIDQHADGEQAALSAEVLSGSCSPTPTAPTTSARPPSARRSCASWSGGCCSRCSTASGASTSTRWTTSGPASTCAPWPTAIRSWSTSARASTCSTRCSTGSRRSRSASSSTSRCRARTSRPPPPRPSRRPPRRQPWPRPTRGRRGCSPARPPRPKPLLRPPLPRPLLPRRTATGTPPRTARRQRSGPHGGRRRSST